MLPHVPPLDIAAIDAAREYDHKAGHYLKLGYVLKAIAPLHSQLAQAGVHLRSMPSPRALCFAKETTAPRKNSRRLSKAACAIETACRAVNDQDMSTPDAIRGMLKELVVKTAHVAHTHSYDGQASSYSEQLLVTLKQLCPSAAGLFESADQVAWNVQLASMQ